MLAAHGEPVGRPRVDAPAPVAGGEGPARADDARPRVAAGRPVVHRRAHDVGGDERVDDAGRLRPARRPRRAPDVEPSCSGRIMRQEGRHIDFYATQAIARLRGNGQAQRLTRIAVRRYWRPVGSDVMPEAEVEFMVGHLFGGAAGRPSSSGSTGTSTGSRVWSGCTCCAPPSTDAPPEPRSSSHRFGSQTVAVRARSCRSPGPCHAVMRKAALSGDMLATERGLSPSARRFCHRIVSSFETIDAPGTEEPVRGPRPEAPLTLGSVGIRPGRWPV